MREKNEFELPDPPEAAIAQDPGLPGFDVMSDAGDKSPPDEKDSAAERRERFDEPDREGHQTAPADDAEEETRED